VAFRDLVLSSLIFLSGGVSFAADPHITVSVTEAGEVFIAEAIIDAPVALQTAWEVLTDFDHMTAILGNLTSSKITMRDGNVLTVDQEGVVKYGLFAFAFESKRKIRLEPMTRISVKALSGTLKRMESELELSQPGQGLGIRIKYRAEIVPDSMLARIFGVSFVRHEVKQQFQYMLAEMKRREARLTSDPSEPPQGKE
jgi:hypothetical protein